MQGETEIVEYKKTLATLHEAVTGLVIETQEHMAGAADLLHAIKQGEKTITVRKEEITRPLMDALASARDLFAPLILGCKEAETVLKYKMKTYMDKEEARVALEKSRIEKRLDKGTMRQDTGIAKLEDLSKTTATTSGQTGTVKSRMVTKLRVVDESVIPREYLVPDMKKIGEAVLHEGKSVPGVEKYQERVVAGY